MSVITIEISDDSVPASLVSTIHKCMNMGNKEVIERIKSGSPIFDREILDSNSEQHFEIIRILLAEIKKTGAHIRIKEDGFVITKETLENILASSEAISDDIRELDELGNA